MNILTASTAISALDDVELVQDLPTAGLTKGWPGRVIYHNGPDDLFCVVEFFWGPHWQDSDMWSVPLDALTKRGTPLDRLEVRRQSTPWLRDQ